MSLSRTALATWITRDAHGPGRPSSSSILAALSLALAAAYAVAIVRSGGDALLLFPLIGALVVLGVLSHPAVGLYVLFGSAILFEQFLVPGLSPITQYSRIFQNLSVYTPIPLRFSLVDLLIFITAAGVAVQRLRGRQEPLRMGALGWAVVAYGAVFLLGIAIGAARGGAWKLDVALNELRAPAHLCVAYFLAANLVRERRQLQVFMWLFVLLVGIKALQAILNYIEARTLSFWLDAVSSHEDVVFWGPAVALTVAAVVLGLRGRLVWALLAMQPIILVAEFVSNRRVGFIALGLTLVAVLLLLCFSHARRAATVAGLGAIVLVSYTVIFWESDGPVAQPLRAVRTVVDASNLPLVDQFSNQWREIENENIAYTVQQLPVTGVGLGQRYLFEREAAEVPFEYWRYITHNAPLWLWLKAGPFGAFALWFLVARALLLGAALYRRHDDPWLRFAVALPITLIVSQIVFSSVELGLTYSRTMIVLGVAVGMVSLLAEQRAPASRPRSTP
ncbi:MAG TPA: O-antigen ligase family protein [Candidatus Limnocylindria bacterium]|nr:O-antigen ligase family protein [Candidatus Limnocylindria bacterium]